MDGQVRKQPSPRAGRMGGWADGPSSASAGRSVPFHSITLRAFGQTKSMSMHKLQFRFTITFINVQLAFQEPPKAEALEPALYYVDN